MKEIDQLRSQIYEKDHEIKRKGAKMSNKRKDQIKNLKKFI